MYSSQEPTVDELFEAIVDLSDREQHDYLDQVGVSRETRQEVLALVQADVDSPRDSNLYSAMPDMNVARLLPDEFAADYMIGQDLGPYRIHDVIGIGGFGTVYQAFRRDHFEQRVAIKVVRADRSMSQEHRLRFEVERSVLAQTRTSKHRQVDRWRLHGRWSLLFRHGVYRWPSAGGVL